MPLDQQKLFYKHYEDVYFSFYIIQIFKKANKLDLQYYQPGDSNYPSGLYGVRPEDRIYINTKPAEKKYRYEVIERKVGDNNDDIYHFGDAAIDENGIQILNADENSFEGRLYGNLFIKNERKEYSIYNMMKSLVKQNNTYQLYNDDNGNENSRYEDYNLFELNDKVKLSTKGDIKIEKGDEIHFMMIIKDKISNGEFIKIGNKDDYIIFTIDEENKIDIFHNDDEDYECVYNHEIKPNEIIEIKHQFKQTISGKLKIEKFNGIILCVKISNYNNEKKEKEIKYFWPLIVPYNLKNIINKDDNNSDSDLVLKGLYKYIYIVINLL